MGTGPKGAKQLRDATSNRPRAQQPISKVSVMAETYLSRPNKLGLGTLTQWKIG
jgi:hypothetical protein